MARNNEKKKNRAVHKTSDDIGLCDDMNFTMAESFKMLRTKLNLTMPQKGDSNRRSDKARGSYR